MIAAVVVLHFPDLSNVERLLDSVVNQVDKVVSVDNTPGEFPELAALLAKYSPPIAYVRLGENKGIAKAQNVGIRLAMEGGYTHVLLLDDDSVLSAGMVSKLIGAEEALLKDGKRVAAVGPQFIDERTGDASCAVHRGWLRVHKNKLDASSATPVETDDLIASGSIIRIVTLQTVGEMREDLFVDFVDTEWNLRARSKGYKSHCVPNVVMKHSIGENSTKIFGKTFFLHSEIRTYYKLRNASYLLRLSTMGWEWRSFALRWIPYYIIGNLCASKNKLRDTRMLLTALTDGLRGRLGPAARYRPAFATNRRG